MHCHYSLLVFFLQQIRTEVVSAWSGCIPPYPAQSPVQSRHTTYKRSGKKRKERWRGLTQCPEIPESTPASLQPQTAGRTYWHEVEPEDIVNSERFQLQDDRCQIAPLHLRNGGLRQLVKGFLWGQEIRTVWGQMSQSNAIIMPKGHFSFSNKRLQDSKIRCIWYHDIQLFHI